MYSVADTHTVTVDFRASVMEHEWSPKYVSGLPKLGQSEAGRQAGKHKITCAQDDKSREDIQTVHIRNHP